MSVGLIGEKLAELLSAQQREETATRFPNLERHANRLHDLSQELGYPTVWPVGSPAERIVGAAMVLSRGSLQVKQSNSDVKGEHILLFAVAAVSPLCLQAAAEQAIEQGATRVEAVTIDELTVDIGPIAACHCIAT